MALTIGTLVTRYSYEHDIVFRVKKITENTVLLHGEEVRLEADADIDDLRPISDRELNEIQKTALEKEAYSFRLFRQDYQLMREKRLAEEKKSIPTNLKSFQMPVKVLHLDGDRLYLKKCIDIYRKLGLQVHGTYMDEKDMPLEIAGLIKKIHPEIIVITGHDAYLKAKGTKKDLQAYRHSKYFIDAVRAARDVIPDLDQLVIFAGACQSHFEGLIRAGANFASSPSRVNIHALDPVYVVAKIAYTPFMEKINVLDCLRNTLTGEEGLGGMETKGFLRTGLPYLKADH